MRNSPRFFAKVSSRLFISLSPCLLLAKAGHHEKVSEKKRLAEFWFHFDKHFRIHEVRVTPWNMKILNRRDGGLVQMSFWCELGDFLGSSG